MRVWKASRLAPVVPQQASKSRRFLPPRKFIIKLGEACENFESDENRHGGYEPLWFAHRRSDRISIDWLFRRSHSQPERHDALRNSWLGRRQPKGAEGRQRN